MPQTASPSWRLRKRRRGTRRGHCVTAAAAVHSSVRLDRCIIAVPYGQTTQLRCSLSSSRGTVQPTRQTHPPSQPPPPVQSASNRPSRGGNFRPIACRGLPYLNYPIALSRCPHAGSIYFDPGRRWMVVSFTGTSLTSVRRSAAGDYFSQRRFRTIAQH